MLAVRAAPSSRVVATVAHGRHDLVGRASPMSVEPAATKVSRGARFDHPGRLVCLWLTLSGRLGPIHACICPCGGGAHGVAPRLPLRLQGARERRGLNPRNASPKLSSLCCRYARAAPWAPTSRLRCGSPPPSSTTRRPCFFACLYWRASAHADRRRPCTLCLACVCPPAAFADCRARVLMAQPAFSARLLLPARSLSCSPPLAPSLSCSPRWSSGCGQQR